MRSHEVWICGKWISAITRPVRSSATRRSPWMPSSRMLAPHFSSASRSSGCVVIPAPRPTNSTVERSYTSTSHPSRRRNAALKRPDIEPPMMMARRRGRVLEFALAIALAVSERPQAGISHVVERHGDAEPGRFAAHIAGKPFELQALAGFQVLEHRNAGVRLVRARVRHRAIDDV